jgi:hypothetical protein
MRTMDLPQSHLSVRPAASSRLCVASLLLLTLVTALPVALAQTTATPATKKPAAAKTAVRRSKGQTAKISAKAKANKAATTAAAPNPNVSTTPAAPPLPDWPVNDQPTPATVVWNSDGLHISADNASLRQILDDVAQATGATVEGSIPNERVFGNFGPGKARDVLAKLLDGSGYDILLIGDQGSGTPRRIVINTLATGARESYTTPKPANKHADDDDDVDDAQPEEPQPQQPSAVRNGPSGQPGQTQGPPQRPSQAGQPGEQQDPPQ